mmetsp:Transcript_79563/g.215166  ORF Transcript_79563/g.215166 Transcript_79563/m.215166 type:complete len:238 (-) Transcript_79563:14-727(-)
MASHDLVVDLRHRHPARLRDVRHLEGGHDHETEGEGKALVDAGPQSLQVALHASILRGPVQGGRRIGVARRLLLECLLVVRPSLLAADTELGQGHDAVADVGPGVLVDVALHGALVVVDEEAARREVDDALLDLREVEGSAHGIRRAAAQVALVVDVEVLLGAEVDLRRQALHLLLRPSQNLVPEIGKVSLPAHLPRGPHRDREAGLHHDERLIGSGGTAAANLTHFAGSLWVAMRT